MKRTVFLALLFFGITLGAMAQNKIDKIMETFSTLGSSTFTTAVERNPQTRKVVKVVKTLEMRGPHGNQLKDAFREEKDQSSYSEKTHDDQTTIIFDTENQNQLRLYMLQTTGKYVATYAKATVIIKIKRAKDD
jgi:hypothetical protein